MNVVEVASVLPDVWADWPVTNGVPYPQWLDWRIGILREFVLAERATWPLTAEEREERRLAKYRRYRRGLKGWERTRRYNGSSKHAECSRKYREWHPRTDASYQSEKGYWRHPVKVDPQTGLIVVQ
jgi:hypothetical protein